MPIADEVRWRDIVKTNSDNAYGKTCVDVARRVMELLDDPNMAAAPDILLPRAMQELSAQDPSNFLPWYAAIFVSSCHSKGEEFRAAWRAGHRWPPENRDV